MVRTVRKSLCDRFRESGERQAIVRVTGWSLLTNQSSCWLVQSDGDAKTTVTSICGGLKGQKTNAKDFSLKTTHLKKMSLEKDITIKRFTLVREIYIEREKAI